MKHTARFSWVICLLLMSALVLHTDVQAKWRTGDQRFYNDNKVCRDGIELGMADTQGDPNNPAPVIYANIGVTLYTTDELPLPDIDESNTFAPATEFGEYIAQPHNITLPVQSTLMQPPGASRLTTNYITTTLRWKDPSAPTNQLLLTPTQQVMVSRDNTLNGGGTNDAFFTTTIEDCYLIAPPTITTQPSSQFVNTGATPTLQVVSGSAGTLAYQWYHGLSGDTSKPVGTNVASLTTPALAATTSYWVRVSNETASIDSTSAIITVTTTLPPPTIAAQPADQSIARGQTTTLNVIVNGTNPSYQWYQGTSGDTSTPIGTNAASYTTPSLTQTTSYWVRAITSTGSVDSRTITVTVAQIPGELHNIYLPVVRKASA